MFLYKKWLYQSLLLTPQKCSECRKWHHFLKFSGALGGPRTPRLNGLASLVFPHFVRSMSGISKRFGQNVLNFLEEKGPRAYNSYFLAETLEAMKCRDRHKSLGNDNEYKIWRNKVIKLINNSKKVQYQTFIDNQRTNGHVNAHLTISQV